MSEWIRLATERSVVIRGLKYAAVVGAILIAINHGDAILAGEPLGADRLLKMILTALVPYMVSTLSSVGAMQALNKSMGSD